MLFYITAWALKLHIFLSFDSRTSIRVFDVFLEVIAIERTSIHCHMTRRTEKNERSLQNLRKIHPERPFDMRISNWTFL